MRICLVAEGCYPYVVGGVSGWINNMIKSFPEHEFIILAIVSDRENSGHLGYIQHLYQNITLPDVDPTTVYQFHHPPLHHYTCVLCMKIVSLFTDNLDVIEEAIQVVPFVCSLVILWAASSMDESTLQPLQDYKP